MSRRQAALWMAAGLGLLGVAWVLWERHAASQAVRVEFVCLTNVPGLGPRALLKVTNLTPDLIIAANCGYLGPNESHTGLFNIPAGTGPWRASVMWQRREFSQFEILVNRSLDELVVAFGRPRYHRDPWLPLDRVSHSAEIQR